MRSDDAGAAGTAVPDDLVTRVRQWVRHDPDPATGAELTALLESATEDAAAAAELTDRFRAPLAFGTAGLRGAVAAGPNRMNRAVVIRTAHALATHLHDLLGAPATTGSTPVSAPPRAVVGHDARHGSADFARDTAAVLTAAGVEVHLLPGAQPTPLLAFAVRHLDADAGVMVTASHNPAADNGYKVYLGGRAVSGPGRGVQIVPPHDVAIAAHIDAAPPADEVPRADGGWRRPGPDLVEAYVRTAVAASAPDETADARGPGAPRPGTPAPDHEGSDIARSDTPPLRIVLTSLHGVGGALALRVLRDAGFTDVHPVPTQADPDPDFPTVAFPNPEEPGAMDAAFALATEVRADLVLAHDPDADRCAVAVPDPAEPSGWRRLHGDEVGALLGEQAARRVALHVPTATVRTAASRTTTSAATTSGTTTRGDHPPTLASSVVSSRLLARIAAAHGVRHVTTLTGFKWISRVEGLVFGYEEALGYCVDPGHVADKDGISAALAVARLTTELRTQGRTLQDALDDLARSHGLHVTRLLAIRMDVDLAAAAVERLRQDPPRDLGPARVARFVDLAAGSADLPPTEGVLLETEDGDRVVVRPSGTEPKLKCYLETVQPVPGPTGDLGTMRALAADRLSGVGAAVTALLGGPSA